MLTPCDFGKQLRNYEFGRKIQGLTPVILWKHPKVIPLSCDFEKKLQAPLWFWEKIQSTSLTHCDFKGKIQVGLIFGDK